MTTHFALVGNKTNGNNSKTSWRAMTSAENRNIGKARKVRNMKLKNCVKIQSEHLKPKRNST